jgi:peptide deformylase
MPKRTDHIKIAQNGDPVLRHKAGEMPVPDITIKKTQDIIAKMSEALYQSTNGIGIAAPQIGVSLPIFLVSEEAIAHAKSIPHEHPIDKRVWKHFVFINPRLLKAAQKKEPMEEGCLSVDGMFGYVRRARQVTMEAYNEKGEKFRVGASGLYAQVLQHEIDHLDGILFIDKAESVAPIETSREQAQDE